MSNEVNVQPGHPVNHDDAENLPSNPSGNRPFREVLQATLSRRRIVKGSLAGAATGFLAPVAASDWGKGAGSKPDKSGRKNGELVGFKPVSLEQATVNNTQSLPTISDDYEYDIIIPWGTPIEPGATSAYEGDPDSRPTSDQASKQIGIGHDGMWFFPIDQKQSLRYGRYGYQMSSEKGMLAVNHEYGDNTHVLGKPNPENLEDVRLAQNVIGVSVVALACRGGKWSVVRSKNSRRITANSLVSFSGPAAASELLQNPNGNVALGTLNNCGSGPTPWGTYLTCEENFNGYFGATDPNWTPTPSQQRYGFSSAGFGYGWEHFDRRFDLSDPDYANECNRFGWVVEIDPFDASQTPVKRTALGRVKHEAIAIAETYTGQIAAYMGDDQAGDYCYKFVSADPWRYAIDNGESPLDKGSLYVARFNEDGSGVWLLLDISNPDLASAFTDQAELLINTRIAADIVGATPMDRPEWTTIGEGDTVFWTMTNNTRRTVANAANPEAPNPDGHIIRTKDDMNGLGTSFEWEIYILASSTRGTENVFSDPDAAYADREGRLFIGTDGGQPDGLQDQLVVFDTTAEIPEPKRLLMGVKNDEITGWTLTPDGRTAFTNSQHPGDGDPALTNFPLPYNGRTIPRDATIVIRRKNGGPVGS